MVRTSVSLASEQGVRSSQEDSLGIFRIHEWECFAVADGYGPPDPSGKQLSNEVVSTLLPAAAEAFQEYGSLNLDNYVSFFNRAFGAIDRATFSFQSGSTLAVAFHHRRDPVLYTAALGDSVIAHLSPTEIRTNPDRHLHLGKSRLWGSFGDHFNARHHQKLPECQSFSVRPGDAILLASDGLFTNHGPGILPELAHYRSLLLERQAAASDLVSIAHREKRTNDNASAIVIQIAAD